MKRILRATAMALGLALALPAYAAVDAMLVTRSGERIAGSLVDFGAGGVTMRVSGQTRTFRIDELAVIDFTNASSYPANELERANSGSHVLVLRNGSVVGGRLADIGGAAPLRISFVEGGATRDFSSDEVARIYFASPTGSNTAASGNLQGGTGQIRVPATSDWVPTGVMVTQGQQIEIRSSGEVRLSSDPADTARTAGSVKGRYATSSPLPSSLAGALIGRIGNSGAFGIGDQGSFTAPASGPLYLRVNDDHLADNTGEFVIDLAAR
jgi:hypothetical protein